MFDKIALVIVSLLLSFSSALSVAKTSGPTSEAATSGLKSVDCWFTIPADLQEKKQWPEHECFEMSVPENYNKPNGRIITFPVLVFRHPNPISGRAPLLHLGAGGPGATMMLNEFYAVEFLLSESLNLWQKQGRDFIVIDPRGSGLSKPLLNCDTFINNITGNLQKNLSLREASKRVKQDYIDCTNRFKTRGIDVGAYNSLSVAQDIERLRSALDIEQWILYGVSYGATYAQIIAGQSPDTVAGMILDSATFPSLKPHHNFFERSFAPYQALYNYCEKSTSCQSPLQNVEQRFWALYRKLSEKPVKVKILHPTQPDTEITLLLNGNLFVESITYGLYGKEIFEQLPEIIVGLEADNTEPLLETIFWYVDYLLDETFADISLMTHYCYETEPFTDKQMIYENALKLPSGYIREAALLLEDWSDFCKHLDIESSNPVVAKETKTTSPTLFLHGRFDTVTPLKDVQRKRANFKNSQLLTYPVSHGVLGVDACADEAAAAFLLDPKADLDKVVCEIESN